jgi:hypothetical protein
VLEGGARFRARYLSSNSASKMLMASVASAELTLIALAIELWDLARQVAHPVPTKAASVGGPDVLPDANEVLCVERWPLGRS